MRFEVIVTGLTRLIYHVEAEDQAEALEAVQDGEVSPYEEEAVGEPIIEVNMVKS